MATSPPTETSFKVVKITETRLKGLRLEEVKKRGYSGDAYLVEMSGGEYHVQEKEELDVLVKYRGLKSASELQGATIRTPMSNATDAMRYEILMATQKGQYKIPSENAVIDKMIDLATASETNDKCTILFSDFIDPETSMKYGQDWEQSKQKVEEFKRKFETSLKKNKGENWSIRESPCDSDIGNRGPIVCVKIIKDGSDVSMISFGPYEYAGFKCKNLSPEPRRDASRNTGTKS